MMQNLFTLFPRALIFSLYSQEHLTFYELLHCIVVLVFILERQWNDGKRELEFNSVKS